MMTRFFLLLLLTVFCTAPLAQAQDPEPAPPTTAEPSDTAEDEEDDEEEDSFRPTEKINVDSSVSFPVDI